MDKKADLATLGVRAGQVRTEFNEHAEALFLTSSFVFDNAAQAAARFPGSEGGFVYSRFTTPTVAMFQARLAALEGAESCIATASGMSAILATAMALLKSGDHIVCSSAVFGATVQLFGTILARFGVDTSFVSPTRVEEWRRALRPSTKILFLETPSNPLTEISDIAALAGGASRRGACLLPRAGVPPAARACPAPAACGRRRGFVRSEGRTKRGVEADRCDPPDLDYRQPGRREDHHHAPGHHHAWPDLGRGARRRRGQRRTGAHCSRPRGGRRPAGRPGARARPADQKRTRRGSRPAASR